MDQYLNNFDLNKSFIDFENKSSNDLFSHLNSKVEKNNSNFDSIPFIKKDSKDSKDSLSSESTLDKEFDGSSETYKIKQIDNFNLLKKKNFKKRFIWK